MLELIPEVRQELALFEAMCDRHLNFLITDFECHVADEAV
jgi:hypothetical protein